MNRIIHTFYKVSFYLPGGSKRKIRYLRKIGMSVGEDLILYDANSIVIDETRPWLVKIGSHVRITHGVVILTHDFSKTVLVHYYGETIGEGNQTVIGDNCFIGVNSVILMGSRIGNNVIVGAGSVVHGTVPDNVVVAGNPARVICTLEEYREKRRKASPEEAGIVATSYYSKYGRYPDEHEMRFFRSLFCGPYMGDEKSGVKTWESYGAFLEDLSGGADNSRDIGQRQ